MYPITVKGLTHYLGSICCSVMDMLGLVTPKQIKTCGVSMQVLNSVKKAYAS
jgi:hypothetical protein